MFGGAALVLTIGKLGRSPGRLEYYDAQVAAGAEDYYAGRGESPGRWRGRGAAALGLSVGGRVARSDFLSLMQGRSPVDQSVLREMGERSTVSGFDLTWSAPKSVSVLFAIDSDHVTRQLLAAHERAIDDALAYLEREACRTRRGRDGVESIAGEGFIAASYRHRMSRAGDPQLHTHVVVANMTKADGRYTALDARWIYAHKSATGAVYRAVLRAEVRERLPWASWRPTGRGLFELVGLPDAVLRHFSQRRIEIEQRAAELVGAGAGGELSRERMQGIALATRKAKDYGVDGASWREESRARAAEHGLGQAELASLRARPTGAPVAVDLTGLATRLSGPDGLTANHNSFARRHALAEIAGAFEQGGTIGQLEDATSGYLVDETVVALRDEADSEARYTTDELLDREREITDGAAARRGEQLGVLAKPLVDQVLAAQPLPLNTQQSAVVRAVASSGRGLDAVTALAGTGKTTMVAALASAYRRAGWQVIGAAPTARAARQLREIAGLEADTIHALLAKLQRTGGFRARTVLVLDEAGAAPTRSTAALFEHGKRSGTKVVAVGDPGQLGSVEAGGWLSAIASGQSHVALRQVMRQQDPHEQAALRELHDGDPGPYLEHKRDAVTVHEKEIDGLLRLAQSWHQAQARYGRREAAMITRDNLTRERLNRLVRARLRADGVVGGDGIVVSGREFATGDRVIARRNNRTADVDNGSIGTIIAVGDDDSVIIETDAGEPRALDAAYVAEHLEHAYVLTSHSAQGATVTWAGVIGRPGDFTREWAYTALSRARTHTAIHVISQRPERARERDDYAPAEPDPTEEETLRALDRAMRRTESEPLAVARVAPRLTPSFRSPSSGMNSEPSGSDVLRNRRPELRASITM